MTRGTLRMRVFYLNSSAGYLVEDVGNILLIIGLLHVAELGRVTCRNKAVVGHKSHALVGHLVAVEVYTIVCVT